jgi:hypothetical protein
MPRGRHPDCGRRLLPQCGLGYRLPEMTLKDQVEQLLPDWESWYPSLFDAARDLGLIRARVCDPGSLLLSNRHAGVNSEAVRAHREQWSVEDDAAPGPKKARPHRRQR